MGSVGRRLERLEGASRESAAARVRRAWDSLTDAEIAALLAPYVGAEELPDGTVRLSREPSPEGLAAKEKLEGAAPEELLERAIGHTEATTPEEAGRRLGALIEPVMRERRSDVRRRLADTEGGPR
jgi:hypothetical protein